MVQHCRKNVVFVFFLQGCHKKSIKTHPQEPQDAPEIIGFGGFLPVSGAIFNECQKLDANAYVGLTFMLFL